MRGRKKVERRGEAQAHGPVSWHRGFLNVLGEGEGRSPRQYYVKRGRVACIGGSVVDESSRTLFTLCRQAWLSVGMVMREGRRRKDSHAQVAVVFLGVGSFEFAV